MSAALDTATPVATPVDRRVRHGWATVGGAAGLLVVTGAVSYAAGVSGWPLGLILILAVPVALRLADAAVRLVVLASGRAVPEPPRLGNSALAGPLAATAVIYPVIVHDEHDVAELVACMRDNRASVGRGPAVHLALVDLPDSDHAEHPGDAALLATVERAVTELAGTPGTPVAVLSRHRRWSPGQRVYLGWERKRGKLAELVALIGGRTDTSYRVSTPAEQDLVTRLRAVRYLLTLDVGSTLLPRAARRLVATLAHPDNAAVVDPRRHVVVAGYGFARPIQSQASPTTVFEWATYPYQVPDGVPSPAQAAYGCDEFVGQGVLDVRVYQQVLLDRIPPDTVLSHDRLEGMHGRTVAVTDARLAEANVADYLQYRGRAHRWVRGDTHLLPWILGTRQVTRLSPVDRYGMARDLLSHLYPPAVLGLLALAWLGPGTAAGSLVASLVLLAVTAHPMLVIPLLPHLAAVRVGWSGGPAGRPRRIVTSCLRARQPSARLARAEAARWAIGLALFADTALVQADAVLRAAYRTLVSRRYVLRWTASARQGRLSTGLGLRVRRLWPTSLLAGVLLAVLAVTDPVRLLWAGPLLVLWLATPLTAYWTGRPARRLPGTTMV